MGSYSAQHTTLTDLTLIPIAFESTPELFERLTELAGIISLNDDFATLRLVAWQFYRQWQAQPAATYTLTLVAASGEQMLHEILAAQVGIEEAIATTGCWKSPSGSFFTAHPLGRTHGKVAFVYPSSFGGLQALTPDLGRDLFELFPDLHEHYFERLSKDCVATKQIFRMLREMPATAEDIPLELPEQQQVDTLIVVATSLAWFHTTVLRDVFGVQPEMFFGYSQGENAIALSSGIWSTAKGGDKLLASDLFKTGIYGPKTLLRRYWQLGDTEGDNDCLWSTYVVWAPVEQVRQALADEPRVYLLIINTDNEVVLGGDPAGLLRVVERLQCAGQQLPLNNLAHTPILAQAYDELVDMNTSPLLQEAYPFRVYSAATYDQIPITQESIAHSVSQTIARPLDFPRLVRKVYADGARIFLEMGLENNCSRWIEQIVQTDQPTAVPAQSVVALAIHTRRTTFLQQLFRMLACLASHQVPVNLAPLYPEQREEAADLSHSDLMEWPSLDYEALATIATYEDTQEHINRLASYQASLRSISDRVDQQIAEVSLVEPTESVQPAIDAPPVVLALPDQPPAVVAAPAPPLITTEQVGAWMFSSLADCFGPRYKVFDGRRSPRLPNGDLRLVHRIRHFEGERHVFTGEPRLIGEYDVPWQAWYLEPYITPEPSYAALMEMALQTCGFLSSYMGAILETPEEDWYYRNLDGEGQLLTLPDLRGQTVTSTAQMLSSQATKGCVVERFLFELACGDAPFYRGSTTFGFFTAELLANQVGLDGGRTVLPWLEQVTRDVPTLPMRKRLFSRSEPPHMQADLLDEAIVVEDGGVQGRGYIWARRAIGPGDWFFACHFYEDPVMPGSLGVEAIMQALRVFCEESGLASQLSAPRYVHTFDRSISWKYRGQVPPTTNAYQVEVHITAIERWPGAITVVGDASLWADQLRIYSVQNITLCLIATN